jgi:membrane associated rhomboid family serine protease
MMKNNVTALTILTICITCVVYFFQIQNANLQIIFGLNLYFMNGAYWQILTTMFIHGGLMHLFMNMVVLFQFGSIIENARGKILFLSLYFGGGILTSLFTFAYIYFINPYTNVVGASGAICVLIGWIAKKDPYNRKGLIVAILIISFAPLLIGVRVAWFAHILGFAIGYIAGKYTR